MKTRTGKTIRAVAAFAALAALSAAGIANEREPLNRSIYVPIRFSVCEHLRNAVLFVNDQAVGTLPIEQILQFTYYPGLDRMVPEVTFVNVEGTRIDGEAFVARLAVSPREITTATERIDLGLEGYVKKFSYRIDVRYKKVNLLIRCGEFCGRSEEASEPLTPAEG